KQLTGEVQYWLDRFNLSAKKKKRVKTFSGGMKRRVNLIAAILHRPKVLFLDEPTVGIDVQSKKVIHESLQELNKGGMTMIYTSHQMEEAEALCSDLSIIDRGEIIAQGHPAGLKDRNGLDSLEDVFISLTGKNLRD
ncbi:MAG: ABC transporter ATP-binding protein, partial [Marinilabiliales bacterium]